MLQHVQAHHRERRITAYDKLDTFSFQIPKVVCILYGTNVGISTQRLPLSLVFYPGRSHKLKHLLRRNRSLHSFSYLPHKKVHLRCLRLFFEKRGYFYQTIFRLFTGPWFPSEKSNCFVSINDWLHDFSFPTRLKNSLSAQENLMKAPGGVILDLEVC